MASSLYYGCTQKDIANEGQRLQDEQEAVQKRTFTKWINSHLAKCTPPLSVADLFEDIKDGVMLLALLEVLSGQKLPCERGRKLQRIHWVANVGTALNFLEGRRSAYRGSPIKLVNINSTDIVDGRPSIVLGLVWTIILYFQIEELTSTLPALQAQCSSSSSMDSSHMDTGSSPAKRKPRLSFQGGAKRALLKWVQAVVTKPLGIEVKDFGPSWRSGVAFHAIISTLRPHVVNMDQVWKRSNQKNLEEAFLLAERELGIPPLLDPKDVDMDKPDEKSIMTYVAQFLKHHPDQRQAHTEEQKEELALAPRDIEEMLEREKRKGLRELKAWLDQLERDSARAQAAEGGFSQQYQSFKQQRVQYELRKKHILAALQSTQRDGMLTVDQALLKQAWERVSNRLLDWHLQLDRALPGALGMVGKWLHQAEGALREEMPIHLSHEETANLLNCKRHQHQELLMGLEEHKQTFQVIHRDGSVNGAPVSPEQLQDMAERFNQVSAAVHIHLSKLEFCEVKHRTLAFLQLAESKLKSWIIKYGQRDSVELLLKSYITFVEEQCFFEKYKTLHQTLKQTAEAYVMLDGSAEVEVRRFVNEVDGQWRSVSVEVRSLKSMLDEVQCNWERYSSTVSCLQAWLEDAQNTLTLPVNTRWEFFHNLPHWIEQHAAMNDAGNFLIETCDDTVVKDLRQQLLLLNGRWRKLFVKVKQYACIDEMEQRDEKQQEVAMTLKEFLDSSEAKLNTPIQVSFLSVRTFIQDVEDITRQFPAMEAQSKLLASGADSITRDTSQEQRSYSHPTSTTLKGRFSKIKERCAQVVTESQVLLPLLEDMEKHITAFYHHVEQAGSITSTKHDKLRNQELLSMQQSCRRCLSAVERSHYSIRRLHGSSKALRNFDQSLLTTRVGELQATAQAVMKEAGEWRRIAEANSTLMRRFEESQAELEKALRIAHACLRERGHPEELHRKHAEFFGRLDQHVLSVFLKACDDLTDILPEEDQQALQETVRKLHKHWKDIQTEAPLHLLRLRVESEQRRMMVLLHDCRSELQREDKALSLASSEKVIKEHKAFFQGKGHLSTCEHRLKTMEELCRKLPEDDSAHQTLEDTSTCLSKVKQQVENTYHKLLQHPDKWSEWQSRFSELSDWLSSQKQQAMHLRDSARDSAHSEQLNATVQVLRGAAKAQGETLVWLRSRLEVLSDVCPKSETERKRASLNELSSEFKALLSSLPLVEKAEPGLHDHEELRKEVSRALDEQREVEEQISRILNAENVEEAKQLLLIHQQKLKRLQAKRKREEQQRSQSQDPSILDKVHSVLRDMENTALVQQENLQVTVSAWQDFEDEREALWQHLCSLQSVMQKELTFSSLESLTAEQEHIKVLENQIGEFDVKADVLLRMALDIQLGCQNQNLLQEQSQSVKEQVQQIESRIKKKAEELEVMRLWWQRFSSESETFSSWICEREKELEAGDSSSLETQVKIVETMRAQLEERVGVLTCLEVESEALAQFVTPSESERIRARLAQIGRYWQDLKEGVELRGGQLHNNVTHKKKFDSDLEEVEKGMQEMKIKLSQQIIHCDSASETYKVLHEYMEISQELQQLQPRLLCLCVGLRRLTEKSQAEKRVADMQQAHEQHTALAAERVTMLEDLLALWQMYERNRSTLLGWMDRSESVCSPHSLCMSTDKTKLLNELRTLEDLLLELPSNESVLHDLETMQASLCSTASEAYVTHLTEDLQELEKRFSWLSKNVQCRLEQFQVHYSKLEQFEEDLLNLTKWTENFLNEVQYLSQVDVSDLQSATDQIKENGVSLQAQATVRDDIQKRVNVFCSNCAPEDLQQFQARMDDCLNPFNKALSLIQWRDKSLLELHNFMDNHRSIQGLINKIRETEESRGTWDRAKAEHVQKVLREATQNVSNLEVQSVCLDGSLSKAHLHLHGPSWPRTSCRALVNVLSEELEALERAVGCRWSKAEALSALWESFRQRKEQLIKNLGELEERAKKGQSVKEVSMPVLQQRLHFFNQLDDELQALQHIQHWLGEKGAQLVEKDSELSREAQREVVQIETTWEQVRKLISHSQDCCSLLMELFKEYQMLRCSISTVVERAELVGACKVEAQNLDVIRKSLSQHEAMKTKMLQADDELVHFTTKGNQLQNEMAKLPESPSHVFGTEMEDVLDRWLDVSEKINANIDVLKHAMALWRDILNIEEDIEQWASSAIAKLTEGAISLSTEEWLPTFKEEMDDKDQQIETLQVKASEITQLASDKQMPSDIQVIECNLQKKLSHVRELYAQLRRSLADYRSQKQQLEYFISQTAAHLKSTDDVLSELSQTSDPEDFSRLKEVQKELKQHQLGLESSQETLNMLCRSYPSQELSYLCRDLTDLVKRSERAAHYCVRAMNSLQETLQHHFSEQIQDFHFWLSELTVSVRSCSDQSGDAAVMADQLQRLKRVLEHVTEGEQRLAQVVDKGERLVLHLPRIGAGQVKDQLASCQRAWEGFVEASRQNQHCLEESAALLNGFEDRVERLQNWMKQMEERLHTEPPLWGDSQQGPPDRSAELDRMEELHREIIMRRNSLDHICHDSFILGEGARGSGEECRVKDRVQSTYHTLLTGVRERLHCLQEIQAFEETLCGLWVWIEEVRDRLTPLDNTVGSKQELEERLECVQDVLLLKGEGEVKLNMAVGKGELVMKSGGKAGREAISSQIQNVEDSWGTLLMTAMRYHSQLEWTVTQWDQYQEGCTQLLQWLEGLEKEVKAPLVPQLGLKEKVFQRDRLRSLLEEMRGHEETLSRLEQHAAELLKTTADPSFSEAERARLRARFDDVTVAVEARVKLTDTVMTEHEQYLQAVRELTDWLMLAREELQCWSDSSGDSASVKKKLSKVRELLERGVLEGREKLRAVRRGAERAGAHTAAAGCEVMDREAGTLTRALEQWEGAALRARDRLEGAVAAAMGSEREQERLVAQLDQEMEQLEALLYAWREGLADAERRNSELEAVEGWSNAKDILEFLLGAEPMAEKLKTQLNELCAFSRDVGPQSDRVSSLIKQHNSLSLRASRECQNKEKLLEQRFRSSLRDFQQWLVNAKVSTAKCFDAPQSVQEASSALQRIQELLRDEEQGRARLNAVLTHTEQLGRVVDTNRAETIKAKATGAREDWESLMSDLQKRETALQNLQTRMRDFEGSVEPLQDWLSATAITVQESSARLHDLSAKKLELRKLQSVLEELGSREAELSSLRDRAQQLWEGQAAGKGFVHQVSQLAAQYLALSNLTKEKASRIDRVVTEHQLFSLGLCELQSWVSEAERVLQICNAPSGDKSILDQRMVQLEALLATRQVKEIELKMLITRGESVQRNTSTEGVPGVRKQIQDLKDSWDSILSASIQCKSRLEDALSHWTSYQEDVSQFVSWMERVDEILSNTDRQYSEMRDKTANLAKAKLLYEEVLSHSSPLETIASKGSSMAEHAVTQAEVLKLKVQYVAIKDKVKDAVCKAEELVLAHQEYQRGLHMFEDWLEQEQESLGCISHSEGDTTALEDTLKELQELRSHCSQGQMMLNTVLASRERVIPWGSPQIEDRALETVQREWQGYQTRLSETKAQLDTALSKLRQMELRFQCLDEWLLDIESKTNLRKHRRSDRATKELQLQQIKRFQAEALRYQAEVDNLGLLGQQVLEETHINGQISIRVTQLTTRYHSLLLQLMETIKQLEEEVSSIEEAEVACAVFSTWLNTSQKNFAAATVTSEGLDSVALEKNMKKIETLQSDMDQGHALLKALRERAERAAAFLDAHGAERLEGEVESRIAQLEELTVALRAEHSALEKSVLLHKEFHDRYKAQAQWVEDTKALLSTSVEPKSELYQRKAQLAKYKSLQQTALSRASAVRSVVEKGQSLQDAFQCPSIRQNIERLQTDYKDLCSAAKVNVQKVEEQVKEQEVYFKELQDVERWLLQMSSRMVTPDPLQGGSLEAATQQVARHKAIMEEIAGFEERLARLKESGDALVSGCSERVQSRLRQQVHSHQQGTRDSYSAICSTAQRVYQSLDRELQRHVCLQDTLQQCQAWLSTVQEKLQPAQHPPLTLEESLKQVKQNRTLQEQASTYLQLVCSTYDLSENAVRESATEIQHVKLQVEEKLLSSQELANSWKEMLGLRIGLEVSLQEAEQYLQNLSRRPAELETKVAQNILDQSQEFIQELEARQADLTQLRENIRRLTLGQESPELTEVGRLCRAWLELGRKAAELVGQREEDLQRSGDYHDCVAIVEELFLQVSREWDSLVRADSESTSEHLADLKKLAADLQEQRGTLEDLKEQKQLVLPRLSLEDKELVKEQMGQLENRWTQLEAVIQQKIQDSSRTIKELYSVVDRLKEAQEWAEEKQPIFSEALKTSPPPDIAQSFLFDHLTICAELEAKQLLLTQVVSEADDMAPRLGLSERRKLQALIQEAQAEVEALGSKVTQRRKYLSKAFTERALFLQALSRAVEWIQQQEGKVLMHKHIALLPDDLSKQVWTCRNILGSLKAYQGELTSLWAQGRDLVKDTTEEEKAETLSILQELQGTFENAFQRCTQRLQELEKALVARKYFKMDLDKTCNWLKQTESVTFPEIDLTANEAMLQTFLRRYQQVLEQASEYENLLLIVQRAGQEILPTLNEVDHCYLDEKLNALPQQYNGILVLAKEKCDRVQQIMLERRNYDCFIEMTKKAVWELQEQSEELEKQNVSKTEDAQRLQCEFQDLLTGLENLDSALKDLRLRADKTHSIGQPCKTEVVDRVVNLHSRLKHHIKQKVIELDKTLSTLAGQKTMVERLDTELKTVKEEVVQLKDSQLSTTESLGSLYAQVDSLEVVESRLKKLTDLSPYPQTTFLQTQVSALQKEILGLQSEVKEQIAACERNVVHNDAPQNEIAKTLVFFQKLSDNLSCSLDASELTAERVEDKLRRTQTMQEEIKSRLRIVGAISKNKRQRFIDHDEQWPEDCNASVEEIMKLESEVQQTLASKQMYLRQLLSLLQVYHPIVTSAQQWLDKATAFIEDNPQEDFENMEEKLRELNDIQGQEQTFMVWMQEIKALGSNLEALVGPGAMETLRNDVKAMSHNGSEVREKLKNHQEIFQRCIAQQSSFLEMREQVVGQLNEVEKTMTSFTTPKAASLQDSEDKLQNHRSVVLVVEGLEDKLALLKKQAAELEQVGISTGTDFSSTVPWQRLTRLCGVLQSQERALEVTAQEWRSFGEKMAKVRSTSDDLQSRIPDSVAEKATSRVALQSLLEYHDSFSHEVERENTTLTLLRQQAFGLLSETDAEAKPYPSLCLQEISSIQQSYDSLLQRVRVSRSQVQAELGEREEVERELGLVKGWIQDTRGLLLSPSADLDMLLLDLEAAHSDVASHRHTVEQIAERQHAKYQDLQTAVPSEISTQLAELNLALGSTEDQVQAREREVQQTRDIRDDFNSQIQDLSEKINLISTKLKTKSRDMDVAKEETKCLCEELDACARTLVGLDGAVKEFGEQNPLLSKHLCSSLAKVADAQSNAVHLGESWSARLRKAEEHLEEYKDLHGFVKNWVQKAEAVTTCTIIWSPAAQLHEQIRAYQSLIREWQDLQGDIEGMVEKVGLVSEVLQTDVMVQQVADLSHHTEELQDKAKKRLDSMQDAAKDVGRLESKVKALHTSLERAQLTLTSPDLARMSLREQLAQRQQLLTEMEHFKRQVETMQQCQSALRLPEEAVASLPICHTAQGLQQETSQLQHTIIQQCNILQEAVVQHEQYEQEVRNLQRLIEEAHRVIQGRPVSTSNIQELQAQIHHHEELAQKIKGYQEQISSLNTKCKMLTVKAKHATMLLSVSEVEGLSDGLEELEEEDEEEEEEMAKHPSAHPSVVMMTAGRCHTLLSPVTEESGEEGTNSEVSSPPACRSPSPVPNAEAPLNQGRAPLCRAPLQELYDPTMELCASSNLDDLQRSWETLKNVISEKQKSLYEALERQQHYQEALQSISTKMESIEAALNEGLEPGKSPESQMAAHQALMDEILMLQDEINDLQSCFSEELFTDSLDSDAADQLALQSTLTVLGERMSTIRMQASGKRQLLEERLSEQLEEQRQEQALQRYHSEADELDHWLLSTRATLSSALEPHPQDMDMEEQLLDCQKMLLEIEQKVVCLSELSVHSESLLLEGRMGTRGDAEQLAQKLQGLKASLLELQRILQDKQVHIQGSLQEQDDGEPDSSLSQSPNVQDWLSQARSTRSQQHQDHIQRQKELEEQLAEQKKLLQSVASRGEELLSKQTTPTDDAPGEPETGAAQLEVLSPQEVIRQRWETLNKDLSVKLKLSFNTLQQEQQSPLYHCLRVSSPGGLFRGEPLTQDCPSPRALFETFSMALEERSKETDRKQMLERQEELCAAVSAASSWLDRAENELLRGPMLLSEDTESHLCHLEALAKEVKEVTEEVQHCREVLRTEEESWQGDEDMMGATLDGLENRLKLLDSTLEHRCEALKDRLQELAAFQADLRLLSVALSDNKFQLQQKICSTLDRCASKQAETVFEAEDSLKEIEQKVLELRNRGETLNLDQVTSQELLKLQDAYEELVQMVGSRRSGLNQNLALKAQYERTLQDLADLVDTAQDKIAADQKMSVGSVIEVQILLDKHKEFFQGLETHLVLTESLFRKVSGVLVQREVQAQEDMVTQAQSILKQAHKRGVELEGILESWSQLVESYQELYRQLEMVECKIPAVGLVEETEDRLNERIGLYQNLKASLMDGQQQLYQLLEDGKRLLLCVCCPDLQNQLTQLGEHWLSCTTKINKELHRLDSTLKHWSRYQTESAELSQWLHSALERLEFWNTQSVTVPQELETVRDHLYAFLDFSKEVDAKSSLRSSVLSTGNQLMRLKKADTAALRSQMAQVENQWAELLTRIPVVQEKLHQLQMEKLASRHAITELMSWITLMENVISEDQQKILEAVDSETIQNYLQKYKGFRIDLICKQLTVDFVNQSVLQMSSQDVEGKRSDKTDFAERLGAMNRRWQILQGLITEKIQVLEGLREAWSEHENGVQALKTWFSMQEEKLKRKCRIEDVASVQNILKDCQELEELMKEKEKELEKFEERDSVLIQDKKGDACTVVKETLKGLNQSWTNLDHMIGQMKVSLKAVLEQWTLYKRASEEINGYLMEGRYSVSRLCLVTGSLEAVQAQVESLEALQEELDKQESSLRKFGSITHQLLKECHPSVAESLNNALCDVSLRWNGLMEQISEQLRSSKALLQMWQHYQDLQDQSRSSVQKLEEKAERLLKSTIERDIAADEVTTWIEDCSDVLKTQESVQSTVHQLHDVGEQLKKQVDPSAVATFQSDHLSLTQRLVTVEQALCKQQSALQAAVQEYESFMEQLESLTQQCAEADQVLKEPDPGGSSDLSSIHERMEKLKDQMLKLSSLSPDLERLNELGYRLPLSDKEIKRMQSLNRSWSSNSAHIIERFSKLQAIQLQQQSFLEKCETWLSFLGETEEKLAREISGNYQSLLKQQREHELFQAEMLSQQQILNSIISDGHLLLDQGQVNSQRYKRAGTAP
ncbi:nesprin-1 isoform X6 [Denticeps clupeoides]|uniref:nesprin-1 isoform X6 n=1 Tax=Denticeps clupeoides TaxID=299321 RepID=UPI0010A444A9|nr:nesprin-1 isoform X6 [Denticeps clupeoides]